MLKFPILPPHGLVTTRQLVTAGWSRSAIHHLDVTRGRVVLKAVHALHRGPLGEDAKLAAAALWAGPDAVLTGSHALLRHGVPLGWKPEHALFLVPRSRTARSSPLARTVRSDRLSPTRTLGDLEVASLERSLTDAGLYQEASARDLRAVTIATLQCRMTTPERIAEALDQARRNGTAGVRLGLKDFLMGAWSLPEAILLRLLTRWRPQLIVIPNPLLTTLDDIVIGRPDVYLPEHAVAICVQSREHHQGFSPDGRDLWAESVEGDGEYQANDIAVCSVTPTTLRDRPQIFLRRLARVLAARPVRQRSDIMVEALTQAS